MDPFCFYFINDCLSYPTFSSICLYAAHSNFKTFVEPECSVEMYATTQLSHFTSVLVREIEV